MIERASDMDSNGHWVHRYYNVMCIRRRKDNVAERMGIGRVVRDLWDNEEDEEIDIELG
jgi:hypothetical protein